LGIGIHASSTKQEDFSSLLLQPQFDEIETTQILASLQRLLMWMLVHQTMSHQEQVDLEEVFVGVQN
jgi:hypothetical protein